MKIKFMLGFCLIGAASIATAQTPPLTMATQCVQQDFVCCQVPGVNGAAPSGQGWYPNFSTTPGQYLCPPVSKEAGAKPLEPITSCQMKADKLSPAVYAMAPAGTWTVVKKNDAIYPKKCGQSLTVATAPPKN